MVETLKQLNMNYMIVIHTNDEYGKSTSTTFSKLAKTTGLCIVYTGLPNTESVDTIFSQMGKVLNKSITVVYLGHVDGALKLIETVWLKRRGRPSSSKITWMFTAKLAEHNGFAKDLADSDILVCVGCNDSVNYVYFGRYYEVIGTLDTNAPSPIASLLSNEGPTGVDVKHVMDGLIALANGVKVVCQYTSAEECKNSINTIVDLIGTTNVNVSKLFTNTMFYPDDDMVVSMRSGVQLFDELQLQVQTKIQGSIEVIYYRMLLALYLIFISFPGQLLKWFTCWFA